MVSVDVKHHVYLLIEHLFFSFFTPADSLSPDGNSALHLCSVLRWPRQADGQRQHPVSGGVDPLAVLRRSRAGGAGE